jgi:hypothetical protein
MHRVRRDLGRVVVGRVLRHAVVILGPGQAVPSDSPYRENWDIDRVALTEASPLTARPAEAPRRDNGEIGDSSIARTMRVGNNVR